MKLNIFESKTIWFNAIMTVLGIVAFLAVSFPDEKNILLANLLITGIGNIVLRVWFTSQPVTFGASEPNPPKSPTA